MKVLITGGTGTISRGIVSELLRMGAEVTLFRRGTTPVPGTRLITGDRYNREDFRKKLENEHFDCVIDMICYQHRDAEELADLFGGRIQQLIFCSTVNTYQAPAPVYPITEACPLGADPQFTYAYEKELCERVLQEAAQEGRFQLTIIRPGATVADDALPISFLGSGQNAVWRLMEGKPLIVLGDGNSLWATAHRDDVGKAIAHAAGNPAAFGKSYTIASEAAMTWEQYYETVANAFGTPAPKFIHLPWEILVKCFPKDCEWSGLNFRFNNIYSSQAAQQDLGFEQTIFWPEIMERSAKFHTAAGDIAPSQIDRKYDSFIQAWGSSTKSFLLNFSSDI